MTANENKRPDATQTKSKRKAKYSRTPAEAINTVIPVIDIVTADPNRSLLGFLCGL